MTWVARTDRITENHKANNVEQVFLYFGIATCESQFTAILPTFKFYLRRWNTPISQVAQLTECDIEVILSNKIVPELSL